MPIETISSYIPKYKLPVFTRIVDEKVNDYTVGETYEFRIEDGDRAEEADEQKTFSWPFEAILVGKERMEFGQVDNMVLAFNGHSVSRSEAIENICPGTNRWDDDKEVAVLTFANVESIKDWVQSDAEVIEPPLVKEEYYNE